jgi:lipid A 4'-phosphatase
MPYLLNTVFFLLFIIYSAVFLIFPTIDIQITNMFYEPTLLGDPLFIGNDNAFVRWWYDVFAWIVKPIVLLLIVSILICYATQLIGNKTVAEKLNAYLPANWFLLLLILCIALIVEVFLKEGFGRPRPRDVMAFGGDLLFTPFMNISDQCSYNCSFASGHAALGFFFMGIAWIKRSALWLIPGILLGGLLGYVRISMGGHFLSDVIMPMFVVFICGQLLSRYILKFWFK